MMQLVKSLDASKYNPRTYIVANTDMLSEKKAMEYEQQLNQVRIVIQSYKKTK